MLFGVHTIFKIHSTTNGQFIYSFAGYTKLLLYNWRFKISVLCKPFFSKLHFPRVLYIVDLKFSAALYGLAILHCIVFFISFLQDVLKWDIPMIRNVYWLEFFFYYLQFITIINFVSQFCLLIVTGFRRDFNFFILWAIKKINLETTIL